MIEELEIEKIKIKADIQKMILIIKENSEFLSTIDIELQPNRLDLISEILQDTIYVLRKNEKKLKEVNLKLEAE